MRWYGEYLWRATLDPGQADQKVTYRVCAVDAEGNRACSLDVGG